MQTSTRRAVHGFLPCRGTPDRALRGNEVPMDLTMRQLMEQTRPITHSDLQAGLITVSVWESQEAETQEELRDWITVSAPTLFARAEDEAASYAMMGGSGDLILRRRPFSNEFRLVMRRVAHARN